MDLHFEQPNISKQVEYNAILRACPQLPTSDYAFSNVYGWADHYGLEVAIEDGLIWIRQTKPETIYWAPVGAWDEYDWGGCPFIRTRGQFTRVPEYLANLWKDYFKTDIELKEVRDHWDYVYYVKELVELRGNRFHKKKNLVKQFQKKYDFDYRPLCNGCVDEVRAMQDKWLRWFEENNPSDALRAENTAIQRVLDKFDDIKGLIGGTLRVEGKVVAYTVAEPVSDDSVVIHFEKGDTRYKGVYQAVNQMFLEHQAQEYVYVNREQDLGDEGLRKAKISYNPALMLKKFEAIIR